MEVKAKEDERRKLDDSYLTWKCGDTDENNISRCAQHLDCDDDLVSDQNFKTFQIV